MGALSSWETLSPTFSKKLQNADSIIHSAFRTWGALSPITEMSPFIRRGMLKKGPSAAKPAASRCSLWTQACRG